VYIRSASARRPFVSNAPPSSHSCAATIGVATFTYLWQAGARSHGVCRAEREGFAAIRQARPLSACGPYSLNWPLSLSCWARFSALRIAATEKESSEGAASVLSVCHPRSLLRTAVVLRVTKRVAVRIPVLVCRQRSARRMPPLGAGGSSHCFDGGETEDEYGSKRQRQSACWRHA
jgi:hypothetical protein